MKLWATRDAKKWQCQNVYIWKREPVARSGIYALDGDAYNFLFVMSFFEFESVYGFLPGPGQKVPVHHLDGRLYDVEGQP